MSKSLLPKKVKVNNTIDVIRLNSNITTDKTKRYTKKSFFNTFLRFIRSYLGVLGDIDGFVQLIPGSYKSEKPITITRIDKIHSKTDCILVSKVNRFTELIL